MPPHYTLVDPACELGEILPGRDDAGDPLLVTHIPRQLMPSWHPNALVCDTTPAQLLAQPDLTFRIAQVAPHETTAVATTRGDVADVLVAEASQWRVAELGPLDLFFGPQAGPLRTVLHTAESVLHNAPDSEQAQRFFDALAQQYAGGSSLVEDYVRAAQAALDATGADGYWWATRETIRGDGTAILALAARDLIGTTRSWTWSAYHALAHPWRRAFGPLHPEDHA